VAAASIAAASSLGPEARASTSPNARAGRIGVETTGRPDARPSISLIGNRVSLKASRR
jgi:hypothetical protein